MPPSELKLRQLVVHDHDSMSVDFTEKSGEGTASGVIPIPGNSSRLFQSLLVDHVNIRTPELHVRTLALHRHVRGNHVIQAHRHRWCQAVLYLSGWGQQMFQDGCADVEPGVLIMLPPGQTHSFRTESNRQVLCLVLDFHLRCVEAPTRKVCALSRGELVSLREQIGCLLRMQGKPRGPLNCDNSVVVLQMAIRLLRIGGWLERVPLAALNASSSAVHQLLLTMGLELPLRQIVVRSGYQRDHLNRLVKKETGVTLGQFRAQRRLSKAKELLVKGIKVGNVAEHVGVSDPSYFARWFRQQTGLSPSRWLDMESASLDLMSQGMVESQRAEGEDCFAV